jgi:tRNA threonylcarbamoyladenosine biosynthesis protein TsaB
VNVLGFDTSTAATSACLLRTDGEAFEVLAPFERLGLPPGHARELMPAVADVMSRAGLRYTDLDAIAVGRGPGTFTGLRIGIATARALATANELPLRPVSSLAALAAGIDAPLRLPLIDARRGELFAALYQGPAERLPAWVGPPAELIERLRRNEAVRPLAAGDGSLRFQEILEAVGVEIAPHGSQRHVVRALHVCRLATEAEAIPAEAVLPDYLRAPDAQPQQ